MILGHGVDLVSLERFRTIYRKFNDRFLYHFLTRDELIDLPLDYDKLISFIAKHWAVKEATSKAIGCGLINGSKLHFKDIVLSQEKNEPFTGMPIIIKTSKLLETICKLYNKNSQEIKNTNFHVSTSGDGDFIIASVIIEIM